jgi:uncharacterized membrane protein HdeD (DUF308 family)
MAKDMAWGARPWRSGQSWLVVGIEGIVALLIGIYTLLQPEAAAGIIRQLIAVVLLVVSAGQIIAGFRAEGSSSAPWATLRGGVGASAALLVLLSLLSTFVPNDGARQILGLGLLAYGVLGIVEAVMSREERELRWGALAGDAMVIVVGFLMLSQSSGDTGSTQLIGWVLVIGGVALLGFTYLLWSRSRANA